jgi:hypothetical protein
MQAQKKNDGIWVYPKPPDDVLENIFSIAFPGELDAAVLFRAQPVLNHVLDCPNLVAVYAEQNRRTQTPMLTSSAAERIIELSSTRALKQTPGPKLAKRATLLHKDSDGTKLSLLHFFLKKKRFELV